MIEHAAIAAEKIVETIAEVEKTAEKIGQALAEATEQASEYISEKGLSTNLSDLDKPVSQEIEGNEAISQNIRMPKENSKIGTFDGERGNSDFIPNESYIPPEVKGKTATNPEEKTLKEIFKDHGIDKITFKDGYPDFSEIAKGKVEINMTEQRYGTEGNFKQADELLAKQKGCDPRDVEEWRKENNYTWHECEDKKTMLKVPNTIHGNIPHDGGISKIKQDMEKNNG